MANGGVKCIENISVGDIVKSWDEGLNKITQGRVTMLFSPVNTNFVDFYIGEAKLTCTQDHPIYIRGKGWCSYDPKLTMSRYNYFVDKPACKIALGDYCYVLERGSFSLRNEKLSFSHAYERDRILTYTFRVEGFHCYFANGVLVHNK